MTHRILNSNPVSLRDLPVATFWLPAGNDCFYQKIGALVNSPWAAEWEASQGTNSTGASIGFNGRLVYRSLRPELTYSGSAISLVGYVQNLNESSQPELLISLDNGTEASQGTLKSGYYVWYQSPLLTDGFHTIGLRVDLGNTSVSTVAFDHALVNITNNDRVPDSERDTAIFDDKDSQITYSGSDWHSGESSGVYRYQNTIQWTNTTDSAFTVPFNGKVFNRVFSVFSANWVGRCWHFCHYRCRPGSARQLHCRILYRW
jgi:hypothetical protein